MSEKKEMDEYNELIQELSEKWDVQNLLSFNEMDIQEKLSINSAKVWHFTELYNKEKNVYDMMCEMKDNVICKRYEHYKTNTNLLLKQSEIEKYYLPKDPEIVKITTLVRKQKWRVDFYQGVKSALEKQQWSMKSFLDSMKAGL